MDDAPTNERIQRLFEDAVSLSTEDRKRFLENNCNDEIERAEVEKLLKYEAIAGGGLTGEVTNELPLTREISESRPGRGPRSSGSLIDHGQFVPGTVLSERYRIVGMLGKGGMGEVYRADDLELGQSVALKFLPGKFADDPRALERFRGEVRLARQVSHPNVCRVYDIGQIAGQWFLSMEYVDGEDLAQLLRRIGRFNADRATELARQLCMGLHAAHEQGVLHRDLKPANIMIDGRGKLLITDFGLAEIADDVRDDDIRSGTPAYMSPEQLAGREVTKRSDIYSLGIILHELFTGQPPWAANSMTELLEKRRSGAAVTPSRHLADLDPLVERVIERCLEPDPEKRPPSALNVIASRPGGDPLAAALGAGETPSPEMVAAAGDGTRVNPRLAGAALLTFILGLLLTIWLEDQTSELSQADLNDEPAVLRHEVQRMLTEEFGYKDPPAEAIYGFRAFDNAVPEPMSFWYRQRSTGGFPVNGFWGADPGKYSWARPDFLQPVFRQPGEIRLILSGDQKLRYLRVVPELGVYSNRSPTDPRWSEWFSPERTGFILSGETENVATYDNDTQDVQVLRPVTDLFWTPPDAFDALGTWQGHNADGTTFYVQAAAWRGRPTYFRMLSGEIVEGPIVTIDDPAPGSEKYPFVFLVLIAALIFGIVLAWHNLRSGRGDRLGGRRLAVYVGVLNSVILLSYFRITTEPLEIWTNILVLGLAMILMEVARTWIWYMALEPFVRRVWPQILISSTRLLEGRFHDVLIGRDVLAGMVGCVFIMSVSKLLQLIHAARDEPLGTVSFFRAVPVMSVREFIGTAAGAHGLAFFMAVLVVMVLLMARIAFRSERASIFAAFGVFTVLPTLLIGGNWMITGVAAMLISATLLVLVVRYGILALLTYYTFRIMLAVVPMTLNTGKWYADEGWAAIGLALIVAVTGFYFATSSRRPLARTGS